MTPRGDKLPISVLVAYYATVAAFFVASFYPEYRVWGISWWAYFPLWVKFLLLAIGMAAPTVIDRVIDRTLKDRDDITPITYRWLVGGFVVVMLALFYFLRARTHFLGDGYTLLSLLATDNHFLKLREIGGGIFQYWLFGILGRGGETTALLAYRIVSFVGGIFFITCLTVLTPRIVSGRLARVLFLLCVLTSGFSMLFFGYVENYALFAVSVLLYVYCAIQLSRREINPMWLIIAQSAAVFFHIFGVVLIPVSLYLVLRPTPLWQKVTTAHILVRTAYAAVLAAGLAAVFFYIYTNDLFFRLALVPFRQDEFTVGHYTMLSLDHLVDVVNIIPNLVPSILVILTTLEATRREVTQEKLEWLTIGSISTLCLGSTFIFDAKLGMPRDWDLFAFAGIPLIVGPLTLLLRTPIKLTSLKASGLILALNVLLLGPRLACLTYPSMMVQHLENYAELDKDKTGPLKYILVKYLLQNGDSATAGRIVNQWYQSDPEQVLVSSTPLGSVPIDSAQWVEVLRRAVKRNPSNWTAWGNLGSMLVVQEKYDSAIYCYRVVDGLRPGYPIVHFNLGLAYYRLKEYDRAEYHLTKSFRLDTLSLRPLLALQYIYRDIEKEKKYVNNLRRIAVREDAPAESVKEWIESLLDDGDYVTASKRITEARGAQLDSTDVMDLVTRYPSLRPYL